jgi:uncharacterized protein with PIN domain
MLGRLARWLRALGYDTLYFGQAEDRRLLEVARADGRTLVTRDRMLARLAEPRSCLIRAEQLDEQIVEAVARLALLPRDADWLSRCLDCNTPLERRERHALAGRVPEHVLATHTEFMGCPLCGKTYWAGSHADRILDRLGRLLGRPARG